MRKKGKTRRNFGGGLREGKVLMKNREKKGQMYREPFRINDQAGTDKKNDAVYKSRIRAQNMRKKSN